MKKITLISFLIIHITALGQNYLVEYEVLNSNNIIKAELFINDTISLFKIIPNKDAKNFETRIFVKNKIDEKAYFTENIMNVKLFVTDSLNNMRWTLTNDTATILDFSCFSATTTFRGRNYTAFYTQSIQAQDGPWKFGGLPGLILSVKSGDNFIMWKAVKVVSDYSKVPELPIIQKENYISWNDFVLKYRVTIDKFIKMARSNGTLSNEASAKIKLDVVEIFYPELQTGEGIKF